MNNFLGHIKEERGGDRVRSEGRILQDQLRSINMWPGVEAFSGLVVQVRSLGDFDSEAAEQSGWAIHRQFEAASVNKLAVAYAVAKLLESTDPDELEMTLSWDKTLEGGGGTFDQKGAETSASLLAVYHDMLANSGNTATKALVTHFGLDEINSVLEKEEFYGTRLLPGENKGEIDFGVTTPYEAARLIVELLNDDYNGNDRLKQAAAEALHNTTTTYGVRSFVQGEDMFLANKTGQLNKEDTAHPVRHDVGIMYDENGQITVYAFMSRSSNNSAAGIANGAIGYFGETLAQQTHNKSATRRRLLAATALDATKGAAKAGKTTVGRLRRRLAAAK